MDIRANLTSLHVQRQHDHELTRETCLSYVYTCIILFLSLFGKIKLKDWIGNVPWKVADYIHGGRVTALATSSQSLVHGRPGISPAW